jgi:hypothetical protein
MQEGGRPSYALRRVVDPQPTVSLCDRVFKRSNSVLRHRSRVAHADACVRRSVERVARELTWSDDPFGMVYVLQITTACVIAYIT